MRKEETQKFEELSLECFGNKYTYRKLMSQRGKPKFFQSSRGLVYDKKFVEGSKKPAYTARRQPLTPAGVLQYMEKTIEMRKQIKKELKEKENNDNAGR